MFSTYWELIFMSSSYQPWDKQHCERGENRGSIICPQSKAGKWKKQASSPGVSGSWAKLDTSVPYLQGLLLPALSTASSPTSASANPWVVTWKAEKTTGQWVATTRGDGPRGRVWRFCFLFGEGASASRNQRQRSTNSTTSQFLFNISCKE